MQLFLYTIGEYLLLLNIIALFISVLVLPHRTAFVAILLFIIILQLLHMWFEGYLLNILADTLEKKDVRTLWYMGFAVTDFLFVWVAISYCNLKELLRDKSSNFILLSTCVLGVVQMLRYADRVLINTDVLGDFYSLSIPTLNLGITFAAITYVSYMCGSELLSFIMSIYERRN
jgi:hypothetical protein